MARYDDSNLHALAAEVADLAIRAGITVCTAESCTGGLVAHLLTRTAGVSAVFQGGIVAYSNRAKVELLGVDAAVLETHGAVSDPVARAMARGACARFHARVGVSTTGIAGPAGGSAEKPVGLVFVAVQGPSIDACSRFQFSGDRMEIVLASAGEALKMLRQAVTARSA
jgi:PncC family amidohydrolase